MKRENVFINAQQTFSFYNEAASGLYSSLKGRIVNMIWDEEEKETPNIEKIKYLKQISFALYIKNRFFCDLTDEEIREFVKEISPILKAINLTKDYDDRMKIIEKNKQYFNNLIESANKLNVVDNKG